MHIELILVIILLSFSGFFSCTETALTSVSKTQLAQLKRRKVKGYKKLFYLKENPGIMLATILIGNNLVNILITTLGTLIVFNLLNSAGIESELWTAVIATFTITFFVLVFGEIMPKTMGLSSGYRYTLFASRVIVFLSYCFKPVVFGLNKFAGFLLFLMRRPTQKSLAITEEELLSVIDAGQETGAIEKEEKNMLHDVIRFGDSFVGEIMTPLDNVIAAAATDTIETLLLKIKDRLPSRIPIYVGARHNIIGILYLKDLLQKITAATADYKKTQIKYFQDLLRPPYIVYIDQKSAQVMRHMRFQHLHIAIVKNHNKKTVGIVTFEDLLEEIVGEIKDEYDRT
ncbi:MAG: hemolysin family protein [Candidatus Margulisbacteria bacterium]|jgi:CBS domain containing-hemolysin-like protein|nr:hemolysin family protein [Candidatus Margulisiibacteriota bacterium]